jgi:UDP-galactopyranose mutase
VVPVLSDHIAQEIRSTYVSRLMDSLLLEHGISHYTLWYYTPMALAFTDHLAPMNIVYDCMDELSKFAGAPEGLMDLERRLLDRADLVLTGGMSLYDAKRSRHSNVHACPSSVDAAHFAAARDAGIDPPDQAQIPHPRMGFFGVIDERMDLELLDGIAAARPDWHLVLLGPVVKISTEVLPRRRNIHYLGAKDYDALPAYIRGWDVALLPFARNEATRFISPTKTPEYLAAGKPVVSTSIQDVVHPYGETGLARIADTVEEFVQAIEASFKDDLEVHMRRADTFLKGMSWDATWQRIERLEAATLSLRSKPPHKNNGGRATVTGSSLHNPREAGSRILAQPGQDHV